MIRLKTDKDIEGIRQSGKIAASVGRILSSEIKLGVALIDLDRIAKDVIGKFDARPAFLGFKPNGASKAYPFTICTSVNETIVHGQPSNYQLREGDIISIDLGVIYQKYYSDIAFTCVVGKVSQIVKDLIKACQEALDRAIAVSKIGNTLGDIGFSIKKTSDDYGFSVIKELTGHGTGFALHEDPTIYNFGEKGKGLKLESGMVLAIEPMLSMGSNRIKQQKDDSYITSDKSLSAHFEHTIAITNKGPQILTI